jgi:hypothetical protein
VITNPSKAIFSFWSVYELRQLFALKTLNSLYRGSSAISRRASPLMGNTCRLATLELHSLMRYLRLKFSLYYSSKKNHYALAVNVTKMTIITYSLPQNLMIAFVQQAQWYTADCLELHFFHSVLSVTYFVFHHHHVVIKELAHLLTRSGLTHTEVFSVVFLGSFYLLGCSFFISLGNLSRAIRFACCIHFLS